MLHEASVGFGPFFGVCCDGCWVDDGLSNGRVEGVERRDEDGGVSEVGLGDIFWGVYGPASGAFVVVGGASGEVAGAFASTCGFSSDDVSKVTIRHQ